jgi:hypothetical protein
MAASYDIIHDRLLLDLSREIINGHKVFHLKQKIDRATLVNANTISQETYDIFSSGSSVQLVKKDTNATYHVNAAQMTCTYKYYHKKGYCKYLVFSINQCNLDSPIIKVKQMLM